MSDYHVDAEETGHNERLIAKALATYPGIPPRPIALSVTRPMVLVCIKSLASAGPASSPPAAITFAGPAGPAMSTAMFRSGTTAAGCAACRLADAGWR